MSTYIWDLYRIRFGYLHRYDRGIADRSFSYDKGVSILAPL